MKVYLVGAGPGDPGLFTLKGKRVLERADTVIYDRLAPESLLEYTRQGAEILYAGKQGGRHTLSQDEINALLIRKAREGRVVVRLKGGDPFLFGRGGEEAEAVVAAGIPFEVVPGVSSALAGPAYAGIPLTHRALASCVSFVAGHEDPGRPGSRLDWKALAAGGGTLVFFMGMKNLPEISGRLIAAGLAPSTPAALVHRGTTSAHRSLAGTIGELPRLAAERGFAAPSLVIVGEVALLRGKLRWFENKPLLGRGIVVTRSAEQSGKAARLLEEEGARVIRFPAIAIRSLADSPPVRDRLDNLEKYRWLLFTSANAVRCFWEALRARGLDSRSLGRGTRVAAVGPATAEALRERGIHADFTPAAANAREVAEGLVDLCGPSLAGMPILLPRARQAGNALPDILAARGALLDILPVYETVPAASPALETRELLEAGEVDCILFTSAATVANFLDQIPAEVLRGQPGTKLACIGPLTAEALAGAGLTCHIQPSRPTIAHLVRQVAEFFV
ncbi:MAG: uroporphyrinogen-III C-methyltransferase [Desulfovibrio sp.]|jgi:uroporphyrinogen III methyltransferase/synthase|nr:uroporphyrinogen-III C-methyltransferase [Desulfovibrio sp.]